MSHPLAPLETRVRFHEQLDRIMEATARGTIVPKQASKEALTLFEQFCEVPQRLNPVAGDLLLEQLHQVGGTAGSLLYGVTFGLLFYCVEIVWSLVKAVIVLGGVGSVAGIGFLIVYLWYI